MKEFDFPLTKIWTGLYADRRNKKDQPVVEVCHNLEPTAEKDYSLHEYVYDMYNDVIPFVVVPTLTPEGIGYWMDEGGDLWIDVGVTSIREDKFIDHSIYFPTVTGEEWIDYATAIFTSSFVADDGDAWVTNGADAWETHTIVEFTSFWTDNDDDVWEDIDPIASYTVTSDWIDNDSDTWEDSNIDKYATDFFIDI